MSENEKKIGQEPAFPNTQFISPDGTVDLGSAYFGDLSSGISKRFYAACCAMQGLISYYGLDYSKNHARESFKLADELLKQENE